MSAPISPINLSATALSVLQSRSGAATTALKSSLDAERNATALLQQASEELAQQAASTTATPRGTLLNIVV
ncbi:MAG TPA: hypothetical protein VMC10_24100 [Stellaceae bacterium]|nr:hypothetical protein [Stellaceae bacterium]